MDDGDDAAWEGWDVESDSSSDSEGWHDVSSDEGDIVISDSDDDRPKSKGKKVQLAEEDEDLKPEDAATPAATEVSLVSNLATTKVPFTPKFPSYFVAHQALLDPYARGFRINKRAPPQSCYNGSRARSCWKIKETKASGAPS